MEDPNYRNPYGKKACRICRHERPVEKVAVKALQKPHQPVKMWVCEECAKMHEIKKSA